MALGDEIMTMVLFGRTMNMHRNVEYIQLNRKQHLKKKERERKIQTHQSG